MNLTVAMLSPESVAPPRRRGRPVVADDPAHRQVHTVVAKARLLFGRTVAELAAAFDVSPQTIRNWTRLALTYPGPIGDALRRADAATRHN